MKNMPIQEKVLLYMAHYHTSTIKKNLSVYVQLWKISRNKIKRSFIKVNTGGASKAET